MSDPIMATHQNPESAASISKMEQEIGPHPELQMELYSTIVNRTEDTTPNSDMPSPGVSKSISRRLYISHFLSTWNSRSFEFGAVLFLADIFPNTLLFMSIYGLMRAASAILFAPSIGRAIDVKNRLSVVRFSIVMQRAAVILSCIGFYCSLTYFPGTSRGPLVVFTGLILLACLEKTCSILNLVSIERDWVVVIASSDVDTLKVLNARMRRIDLFCKLGGPLFISLIDGASGKIAILLTLGLNIISVPIEYFAIAKVYNLVPNLHTPNATSSAKSPNLLQTLSLAISLTWVKEVYKIFRYYFHHSACSPSFALALLYLTVLSFGGQMVTYLLTAGYNPLYIALVRTLSVVFEISATWVAPRAMSKIGASRAGMWFLSWQMFWLGAAVSFFWAEKDQVIAASALAAGTILSRTGLWGYDLCAQLIIQEEVQGTHRGSFSSTEASFQNAFELLSYVLTIIFSNPSQFRYPLLLSAVAVYTAGFIYGRFLRKRRGHLMHIPDCIKGGVQDDNG